MFHPIIQRIMNNRADVPILNNNRDILLLYFQWFFNTVENVSIIRNHIGTKNLLCENGFVKLYRLYLFYISYTHEKKVILEYENQILSKNNIDLKLGKTDTSGTF